MKESSGNILLCGGVLYDSELLMLHLDHLLNNTHTSKKKKDIDTIKRICTWHNQAFSLSVSCISAHSVREHMCVCVCVP